MTRESPRPDGSVNPDDLQKAYDPHAIEARIYEHWEQGGWFAPSGAVSAVTDLKRPRFMIASRDASTSFA